MEEVVEILEQISITMVDDIDYLRGAGDDISVRSDVDLLRDLRAVRHDAHTALEMIFREFPKLRL